MNNVVGSDKAVLIAGIMLGYEIDVANWITQEIGDMATSTNTVLAFPCQLTQIFLEMRVLDLLNID